MRSFSTRLVGSVVALVLGYFLFLQVRSATVNYWLRADSQQGLATITKEYWGGHGRVVYRYAVDSREYTGVSGRNWQDPRYRNVQPGDQAVVYFSTSHPWVSLLYQPRAIVEGWPVLIVAMFFEFFAAMAVVRPGSKWAFDFGNSKSSTAKSL